MIGIIGAMHVEIERLKPEMGGAKLRTVSGIEFVSGTLRGQSVVLAACGIGKVAAAVCAQTMMLLYSPELIVMTGVAGGLDPKLGPLDVAVAAAVVQHDMDTSAIGDPVGLISGLNVVEMPCGAEASSLLERSVQKLGTRTVRGVIASGDRFVSDPESADRIVSLFGAVACDMESGAVGQVCLMNGVNFCCLRAISDKADSASPMDYGRFLTLAADIAAAAVLNFLEGL